MEPIREILKPLNIIRAVLIVAGLLVMFFNLFDCIMQGVPVFDYALNVGTLLVFVLALTLIANDNIVIWVIYSVSIITLIYETTPNKVSYIVTILVLTLFLKRDLYFKAIVYFSNFIIVVCVHVFKGLSSTTDLINTLIGYSVVYIVAELVYIELIRRITLDIETSIKKGEE